MRDRARRRSGRRAWPDGVTRASVLAGGGVVLRDTEAGPELVVVHRPRYDDWSLPKGKVDRGETVLEAALREVAEETGLHAEPGPEAGVVRYVDGKGRPKEARYWLMRVVADGPPRPGDEVDRWEWWPVERAVRHLTYDHDRDLVAALEL
jgi:8-oxo-dGTP pyrophosphatase MutT (NUDIX family)